MTKLLAGRYRLDQQIATGGMGAVWRAHDQVLERPVAIKLLHDRLADDTVAAQRFKREALMAASISHPNMANVFDYIEEGGKPGIVMELVESETLAQRIARDGALPPQEAARIACAVLDALVAAHHVGIVHRDVKPANILVMKNGTVKVADFGIARSLGDATLTATGTVMGTAHYSAPEQVRGEPATAVSDQYSLGVVLYEMLAGARPFTGDTAVAVAMARLTEQPRSIRAAVPAVPAALEAVVMRALAREPADRFPDAHAMRRALDAAVNGAAIDSTQVLAGAPMDETIPLSSAALPGGASARPEPQTDETPLADVVPPSWWGKRVMVVLLPLILVGILAWLISAVLAGPGSVVVPKLTGLTLAEARSLAEKEGVAVDIVPVSSTKKQDTVVAQSPQPGRTVEEGSSVRIEVSRGDLVNTPDLAGMSEEQALAELDDRNLRLGDTTYQVRPDVPFGTIVGQSPSPGRNVKPGTSVDIVLALSGERDGRGNGKGKKDEGDD